MPELRARLWYRMARAAGFHSPLGSALLERIFEEAGGVTTEDDWPLDLLAACHLLGMRDVASRELQAEATRRLEERWQLLVFPRCSRRAQTPTHSTSRSRCVAFAGSPRPPLEATASSPSVGPDDIRGTSLSEGSPRVSSGPTDGNVLDYRYDLEDHRHRQE